MFFQRTKYLRLDGMLNVSNQGDLYVHLFWYTIWKCSTIEQVHAFGCKAMLDVLSDLIWISVPVDVLILDVKSHCAACICPEWLVERLHLHRWQGKPFARVTGWNFFPIPIKLYVSWTCSSNTTEKNLFRQVVSNHMNYRMDPKPD